MAEILGIEEMRWLTILLAIVSVASLVLALTALARYAGLRNRFDTQLATLEKQLKVVVSGAVGMGEHLVQLESELKQLRENQAQTVEAEEGYCYSQAIKLIEQGLDSATVAANSGLSDCEVQLMELVHKNAGKIAV